ncbi:MAG: hypothetical protein ACLFVR_16090, partial [Thiohalospira sp.]
IKKQEQELNDLLKEAYNSDPNSFLAEKAQEVEKAYNKFHIAILEKNIKKNKNIIILYSILIPAILVATVFQFTTQNWFSFSTNVLLIVFNTFILVRHIKLFKKARIDLVKKCLA